MNDRFKFRYVYENKVYDVTTLDLTSNKFAWLDNGIVDTLNYDNLLQCTGLKDKNGKLIYENDIVKVPFEDGTLTVVKWIDAFACFELCLDEQGGISLGEFDADELEVIGNIYENPELLLLGGEND